MSLDGDLNPLLSLCLANVVDGRPASNKDWTNTLFVAAAAVKTIHRPDIASMLNQSRRRWSNIKTTLCQCIVLTGHCTHSKNDDPALGSCRSTVWDAVPTLNSDRYRHYASAGILPCYNKSKLEGNCDFSSSNNVWTRSYEFFGGHFEFFLLWQIDWSFVNGFLVATWNWKFRLQNSDFKF